MYGAVACGWITSLRAHSSVAADDSASAALGTIRSWPGKTVLRQQGSAASALEDEADSAIAARTTGYQSALDC